MSNWFNDAIFYHIYPLGLAGVSVNNDHSMQPQHGLRQITPWIDHCVSLGVNALYIGPLFESTSHGYDTTDYFMVDRRLGTNDDFAEFVQKCHSCGVKVIVDAVFNHVGREHFAFRDLQQNGWNSHYRDWFITNFDRRSNYGDSFWYEGWNGHYNLVKLQLNSHNVRKHIFDAVAYWMDAFGIDGLRLDAADSIDKNFFNELRHFCNARRPDFWLMGEVIHGNYRDWVNGDKLDSVTNYECYKGLWSSHNDANYFEIAHTLDRQYGTYGIYKGISLYNFADNHDVDRVATCLKNSAHIYPLYLLLFTIPGIPSVYYGSEWGIDGKKIRGTDTPLRPALNLDKQNSEPGGNSIKNEIRKFISIRKQLSALRYGSYKSLLVKSQQYAFLRETDSSTVIVAVNAATENVAAEMHLSFPDGTVVVDKLNNNEPFIIQNGKLDVVLYSFWGRVMEVV